MTIDLDELERLEREATAGPWGVYPQPVGTVADAIDEATALVRGTPRFQGVFWMLTTDKALAPAVTGCGAESADNAAFIVALRNAAPALIAEIRELRGRAKMAESERDAERLRYGQQAARNAVFMRALATLARREGLAEWAQNVVREADHAMMRVRPEDFTMASPGGSVATKDRCTP